MIFLLLINKILAFFLIMIAGIALVKMNVLKAAESRVVSLIFIYLIMPCTVINSFQVSYSEEVRNGIIFVFIIAFAIHIFLFVANEAWKRLFKLSPVEQTSVMYPACINLTVPLVTAMMGSEWVIYTSPYMAIQMILLWSHAKTVISGEKGFELKKVITNINMIAVFVGIVMFLTHFTMAGPVKDAVSTLGNMIGPIAMLIAGMLVADTDIRRILANKRLWLVTVLRLLVIPMILLLVFRLMPLKDMIANGDKLLLILIMGICTPPAGSLIQMAQIYGGGEKDAVYASQINVMTTIFCMLTIPLLVLLYSL